MTPVRRWRLIPLRCNRSGNVLSGLEAKPLRPLDNLMCPAIAIELAPLPAPGVGAPPVTDAAYQQQVAPALATSLTTWRNQLEPTADNDTQTPTPRAIATAESAARVAARAHAAALAGTPQSPPPQKAAQ